MRAKGSLEQAPYSFSSCSCAPSRPLILAFSTLDGLNTITRRGRIGASTPVFGPPSASVYYRPIRETDAASPAGGNANAGRGSLERAPSSFSSFSCAPSRPLILAFSTLDGLNTITRRGRIGASTPVFGPPLASVHYRPIREDAASPAGGNANAGRGSPGTSALFFFVFFVRPVASVDLGLQHVGRLEHHHPARQDRHLDARLRVAAHALALGADDK